MPSYWTRLERATERLAKVAETEASLVAERATCVEGLRAEGWSLAEIAAECGVTKSAIAKWGDPARVDRAVDRHTLGAH
jgi:hypothetical protein